MNRKIFTAATLVLSGGICSAQYVSPTDADADAFIKAYVFEGFETALNEQLSFRIQSRTISDSQGRCVKLQMTKALGDLFPEMRQIVISSFFEQDELQAATAFFLSPTGKKIKDFNHSSVAAVIHSSLRNEPLPSIAPLPPSFTSEDVQLAAQFMSSLPGSDFKNFVKRGIPQFEHKELLDNAISTCSSSFKP